MSNGETEEDEDDLSSCLMCEHSTFGYCQAHDIQVSPFNNCSDFNVERKYKMGVYWIKKINQRLQVEVSTKL